MSGHLDLIIGKPNLGADEKIATFTRFVLPFAFQLQPIEHEPNQADLFYTLNDKTTCLLSSDENILLEKLLMLCMNRGNGYQYARHGTKLHGEKPRLPLT